MQLHNQPDLPVLASTGKQSFTGEPLQSSSHPQISTPGGGSSCSFFPPHHHCQRTPSPQANARELQAMVISHIPKQEGKGGEGEEGKEFKFSYLLTETQKRTHMQAPLLAEIPAVRAVELCFQQGFLCLELHRSLLSLSQEQSEECSALPAPVYLSFNARVIH